MRTRLRVTPTFVQAEGGRGGSRIRSCEDDPLSPSRRESPGGGEEEEDLDPFRLEYVDVVLP